MSNYIIWLILYYLIGCAVLIYHQLKTYSMLRFSGFDLFMCVVITWPWWPLFALSLITIKKGY